MKADILSVDWDYFFPCLDGFDWGHSEDNPLFFQLIWQTRPGNVDMVTKKRAIDIVHPTGHEEFWARTLTNDPFILCIAESHADIFQWLKQHRIKKATVTNFDAHHDFGYHDAKEDRKEGFNPRKGKSLPKGLNCGNWAKLGVEKGLIESYKLVYPAWRKQDPEGSRIPCENVSYEPPPAQRYDFVFVCRSSSWTPSWSDDAWLKFINWWSTREAWTYKSYAPFAMKQRSPDLAEARQLAEDWDKMLDKARSKEVIA